MTRDASGIFNPNRVAVVGATDREGSIGRAVFENLDAFDGSVVPVNPGRDEVLGEQCYTDLSSVPEGVDLAIVVVPPQFVADVLRDAGEAGIVDVVVITAGFSEAGGEGATRERELRDVAQKYDLNVVGPNSLGVMSTPESMNATFGPDIAPSGSLSFMSQSGAFITAVLDWAADEGLGFKDVVSLGNKAVMDETDFIEFWADDPETNVVLGYLEGISNGRTFIDTARESTQSTPVVVVKSGRTSAGAQAASSHTGTIAGSEAAYEAGLEQAGVVRAENVQQLFDYARVLDGLPLPSGNSVAVVTNAGGPGVMATDAIGDSRLEMASFGDPTIDRLHEALPSNANVYNPVDIIGDADLGRFVDALDIVLADDEVAAAIVVSAPTAIIEYGDLADEIVAARDEHDKPVIACLMGGDRVREPGRRLGDAGVPNYFDPARAVDALSALDRYREVSTREYDPPATYDDVDSERAETILQTVEGRDTNRLGVEAMDILDAYGITVPDGAVVDTPDDAVTSAQSIDGPVVMKIVSPDITHKSDIGGVKVGVPNEEVYDAFEDLVTRARNYQPDASILGVQVQELVDTDAGTETIVGTNRDPQFGPLVLFGLGGIFVEILEDTTVRVAPLSERETEDMLEDIQAAPLLRGARGRQPVDRDALAECIGRISQLVTDFPAILELDINPLLASADDAMALDLRLTVDPDSL